MSTFTIKVGRHEEKKITIHEAEKLKQMRAAPQGEEGWGVGNRLVQGVLLSGGERVPPVVNIAHMF